MSGGGKGIRGSIAEFGGVINDFWGEGRGGGFAVPMLDILVHMIPHDNIYIIISACMIYTCNIQIQ